MLIVKLSLILPTGYDSIETARKTILEASQEIGVDLESICGGRATCGKCKVKIKSGFFEKYGINSSAEAVSSMEENAVQLAKGAMYAGAKLMMRHLGVERPEKIILAGAFGSYIDKKSAMFIGLFRDCPLENVQSMGNAAGERARLALLNIDKRKETDEIARKVEYIKLALEPDFDKQFAHAMYFHHAG